VASAWRVAPAAGAPIYWGAYIKGSTYGFEDAPYDARTIDAFESHAGKRASIIHWGQPWYWGSQGGYQRFRREMVERVRLRGSIPMITWTSGDLDKGASVDQPAFQLLDITNGAHDAYIRQWARDAKAWGHPFFVRFNHEMNGSWFVWSERRNGNGSGQFAPMWRHVVDIFRQEGATNVTWVWAPNRVWPAAIPLAGLYPGDGYVDWTGFSAYNWGTNPAKPGNVWHSFTEVLRQTYDELVALAPQAPIMLTETASSEYGGSKAAWITDMLQSQLPVNWPQVKAFVWFNWNAAATNGAMDWVIESSSSARAAFAAGIASSHYASNTFGSLTPRTKVQPPTDAPAVAGTPSPPAAGRPRTSRRATIISLGISRRCRGGRSPCLRIVWRGPRLAGRLKFGIVVRQVGRGTLVARASGSAIGGRRRTVVLGPIHQLRCGRVEARLLVRRAGKVYRAIRRAPVRRACVRPVAVR
jgi:hypothetical protein